MNEELIELQTVLTKIVNKNKINGYDSYLLQSIIYDIVYHITNK